MDCNLQECDNFYENNEFEESLLKITDNARRFQNAVVEIPHTTAMKIMRQDEARKKGPKVLPHLNRFQMVKFVTSFAFLTMQRQLIKTLVIKSLHPNKVCTIFQVQTNYEDILGKNAGSCLYNQRKYFKKVMSKWKPHLMPAAGDFELTADCDVVSLDEGKIQSKSVREKHRQETVERRLAQRYLMSAWKGYDFLKQLKKNQTLLESTQNMKSFNTIFDAIDEGIQTQDALIVSSMMF